MELNLSYVIGFDGTIPNCIQYHPDGKHILFSLGATVVIQNIEKRHQIFLRGHSDNVTCFAISRDGKYVASGQSTHMGFIAPVKVWDYEKALQNSGKAGDECIYTLELHKVKVQAVGFSPNGDFLSTLGGQDDNNIVMWDMKTGEAICGSPSYSDSSLRLCWFNNNNYALITCGRYYIRVWEFDRPNRKLHPTDVLIGQYKRVFLSVCINENDDTIYAGAETGDILKINAVSARVSCAIDKRYSLGVSSLYVYTQGNGANQKDILLFGTGDGIFGRAISTKTSFKQDIFVNLDGMINGITINNNFDMIMAGTQHGNLYELDISKLTPRLRETAHSNVINDISFAQNCDQICATASVGEIRLWNNKLHKEILRIKVPTQTCICLKISPDGRSIISGWSDGKIRAFYPESGKLLYIIHDVHKGAVTALDVTKDSRHILSGGEDGEVRLWELLVSKQKLEVALKAHKNTINWVKIRDDDLQAISCSNDGSIIVWDLKRFVRVTAFYANTMFKCGLYYIDNTQLLSCGSDRKITYYDLVDNVAIRILTPKGCDKDINSLDISQDGKFFVSGSGDMLVRLWDYNEGYVKYEGIGHSGCINKVVFSPLQNYIVSVGSDNGIFIWNLPRE